MQCSLYFISVTLLATATFLLYRRYGYRYCIFACLILFLGQTQLFQLWNNYISRESLSNSLLIFSCSMLVFSIPSTKIPTLEKLMVIQLILPSIAIITKPIFIPVSLTICLIQFIWLIKKQSGSAKKLYLKIPTRLLAIFLLLIIFLGYSFINASNQNLGWSHADPTGRTLKEISYAYAISDFNPAAREFLNYLAAQNVGSCFRPKFPISTKKNLGAPMDFAGAIRSKCPSFSIWVANHYIKTYLGFYISMPSQLYEAIAVPFNQSFKFVGDGRSQSLTGYGISKILLLDFNSFSTYLFLIIFLLSSWTIRMKIAPLTLRRKIMIENSLSSILVLALSAAIVLSVILQPTHPADLSRQNYSFNLLLRSLVIWQIMELFFDLIENRKRRHKIE